MYTFALLARKRKLVQTLRTYW